MMMIDRMSPGFDGIAIIKRLREVGVTTPALIASALGEVDDQVRGLRDGEDDYLVKPFACAELLARVEALARRSATVVKETALQVGDRKLDLLSRTVTPSCFPGNFKFSDIWFAMRATSFREQCCFSMCGICMSNPRPMSSTPMSGVRRKIDSQQAYPLINTYEASGFASVLKTKPLALCTQKSAQSASASSARGRGKFKPLPRLIGWVGSPQSMVVRALKTSRLKIRQRRGQREERSWTNHQAAVSSCEI
jgi:two-component system, OmpR family, response regulator